jgi:cholest-4-en-3-one 26-monooxygenase
VFGPLPGGDVDTLSIDLSDPRSFTDGPPHAAFDRLRETSPVAWNPAAAGTPTGGFWSLTRFDHCSRVSRDTARFTSTHGMCFPSQPERGPSMVDNVMWVDPPLHTRIRGLASRGFSTRVVARFEDWVRERVVEILDGLPMGQPFDAVELIAAELPAQVIASVMGAPIEDRRRIVAWANDIFAREEPGGYERAGAALGAVFAYANELREVKRSQPAADMITDLSNAEYDGVPITDGEYQQFVMSLLIAGFETTHTLIGQSLRLMVEHREIDEQVRTSTSADGGRAAVEELLRYITPAMHMARTSTAAVLVGDVEIPAGDLVVLWYVAANRDPDVFDDPHSFRVGRTGAAHQSFGAGGPHYCIGQQLARLEGRVLLEEMVRRDLRFDLAGDPQRRPTVFINALHSLPVTQRGTGA